MMSDNYVKNLSNSCEVDSSLSRSRQMLSKVPEVTIFFWIIKIMATTVGETAADFLTFNLNFGLTLTTIIMSSFLIIALFFQFRSRKYVPGIYWLAVVMISIVGTLITDNLVDNYGVALETTTIIFTFAMVATFAAWYASEKTLSIHSIYTTKREAFYWLAILFTFALGTAAGDLISEGLDVGYWKAAIMFSTLIGIVTVSYYRFKLNSVVAFWMAYILTRPLGASIGDYLSQPLNAGGLALNTMGINAVFFVTILSLVIYLTKTEKDKSHIVE